MTTRRVVLQGLAALASSGSLLNGAAAANQDTLIISGASGQLGKLVVKDLLARGVPAQRLILSTRTPQTLAEFAKLGAVVRRGDLFDTGSLRAAFAGGTRMLLISIGYDERGTRPEAHRNGIEAAKAAGVKQIAYTSFVAISKGQTDKLATDHFATEELLKKSGLAWTFLRNSIYMDELLPEAAKMVATGQASIPRNESRIGYVTRQNCADAAAAVLAPGHDNKAYDITGPELLGTREAAVTASAVTGKPIKVSAADPGAPAVPDWYDGPSVAVVSNAVKQLTGKPPTSLRAFFTANKQVLLAGAK